MKYNKVYPLKVLVEEYMWLDIQIQNYLQQSKLDSDASVLVSKPFQLPAILARVAMAKLDQRSLPFFRSHSLSRFPH